LIDHNGAFPIVDFERIAKAHLFWCNTMEWTGRSLIFNLLKKYIRLRFPLVSQMTTVGFAQMENSEELYPLVLDVRSKEEYDVSHLMKARHVDINSDALMKQALKQPINQAIVVYCSVGYRSAKAAQQLKQAGFNPVFNLEGGLFQWANEDRPLFHSGQPTRQVHPYNAMWGILLENRDRSAQGRIKGA
jgi:rhodanese-related sulfurtransferase